MSIVCRFTKKGYKKLPIPKSHTAINKVPSYVLFNVLTCPSTLLNVPSDTSCTRPVIVCRADG